MPEITVTCGFEKLFVNSITVGQYKKYAALMERNQSDRIEDVMFFNKKILQEIFGSRISLEELGEMDVMEFLAAVGEIHFTMRNIVTQKLLTLVRVEQVEKEESIFDEYDRENGYEEEEPEQNEWKTCGEIIDRIIKIAIRIMKNSYSQCMGEDIISMIDYLKFELDTADEY
jgi:hypothetical protein